MATKRPLTTREPLAIIGIGCRFPGKIGSPDELWRFLQNRGDAIAEIPPERRVLMGLDDPPAIGPEGSATRFAGLLDGIDQFDGDFFSTSPREGERLDPQQRLLLEVAWEALEDAGQVRSRLAGTRTGVYVGQWLSDFERVLIDDPAQADIYMTTGSGRYAASGRLSYFLDLQGPSLTLDTACSSSLVAVHLACRSLWSGECDLALAGGVNLILQGHITAAYARAGMLAVDGRCKFGDERADGYVRSEGAGIVVLKPLTRAQADGDRVYALIRGSAVNNDGHGGGNLVTPSRDGHESLLRRAYADAGVDPRLVRYVEAHGTGTTVGDPVELQALGAVIGAQRPPDRSCIVGSVKGNIGHTESAAGVAGLIKAALVLHRREIPATLHCRRPNPAVPWDTLGLTIAAEPTPWPDGDAPALAGVNSFGITGTNAHVVLEEPPRTTVATIRAESGLRVLPLSAHTPEALHDLAERYLAFLQETVSTASLHDLCYTASVRRTHHRYRWAAVGDSRQNLVEQLGAFTRGDPRPEALGSGSETESGQTVFVFPGQGAQWAGMGRELMDTEPVFRAAVQRCADACQPFMAWPLIPALREGAGLDRIDVVQPALFAVQVGLAELWTSWGVCPDAVVGHSMGEVAAAHVAGILRLEDAARVICTRSQLLRRISGHGAMAVVELSLDDAEHELADEAQLSIAVNNSPRSTVLAGDPEVLDRLLDRLRARGIFCRRINVDVASHTPHVQPLRGELLANLAALHPSAASVPFYSTVRAEALDGPVLNAQYWFDNLRRPVRFGPTIGRLLDDGHTVMVEISPHPILLPAIQQCLQEAHHEGIVVPSLHRETGASVTLLGSLARLYEAGRDLDWRALYPEGGVCTHLPPYPWQRQRLWLEPAAHAGHPVRWRRAREDGAHPLLGSPFQSAAQPDVLTWEIRLDQTQTPYLADHRVQGSVVLPAAAIVELALAAASQASTTGHARVERLSFEHAIVLPEDGALILQLVLTRRPPGAADFRVFTHPATSEQTANAWTLHARGAVRETGPATSEQAARDGWPEANAALPDRVTSGSQHYDRMARRQIQYGQAFRGVVEIRQHDRTLLGRLQAPEGAADHNARHALLDGALQLLVAALPPETDGETYVPVGLESVQVGAWPAVGAPVWGIARLERLDGETGSVAIGDVQVADAAGRLVADIRGLRLQRLEHAASGRLDGLLYTIEWKPARQLPAPDRPASRGSWLILADRRGIGQRLADRLVALGERCVIAEPGEGWAELGPDRYRVSPSSAEMFSRLLTTAFGAAEPPLRGIVSLWSLDHAAPADRAPDPVASGTATCLDALRLAQALLSLELTAPPELCFVTAGAQYVSPADDVSVSQTPLWGFGRSLALEHGEVRCRLIDLSPRPDAADAEALVSELLFAGAGERQDDQVALRGAQRYCARLARRTVADLTTVRSVAAVPEAVPAGPEQSFRVEASRPGMLDSVILRATERQAPGPDEVEIAVQAAGLNFLDVMKAMGVYPGLDLSPRTALGAECAGTVVAVGTGVNGFIPGDEVVAMTASFTELSCLSAYVTVPARFVAHRPLHVSPEVAAGQPIAFMTAAYALHELARLRAGERVLIHAAAGGVGLAATQLAHRTGAEIFATSGSAEKRAFLRSLGIEHVMDSRSLAFVDETLARTRGVGVDVVLNSLAGDAIAANLEVLAPRGRYLELGKQDIYQDAKVGLGPFRKNLSFFAIDLAQLTTDSPDEVAELFQDTIRRFERRELEPLPARSFAIDEAAEAFRFMAQARHIGKLVLSVEPRSRMLAPIRDDRSATIRADGTYLITGGLGALGLQVAHRLVERGARHLVLVGRRPPSDAARATLAELEAVADRVLVVSADVTRLDECARVFTEASAQLPPLRGVVHAAGVLADATVRQLDAGQLRTALAPKLAGAWNLHALTLDQRLDFFVLFSSITSLLGGAGQANYAAGNAFLDGLAAYRRAHGLPALGINWGPWSGVGLAAARSDRGERLASRGVGSLAPGQATDAFERLVRGSLDAAAVVPFDVERWCASYPSAARSSFFTELRTDQRAQPQSSEVRARLLAAEPGRQRRSIFETYLREQLSSVLRLPPERIDARRPLSTHGLDSLMALELRNRLEVQLGLTLSATLVWTYPTLTSLATHLAGLLGAPLDEVAPDGAAPSATHPADRRQSDVPDRTDPDATQPTAVEAALAEELAEIDMLLGRV